MKVIIFTTLFILSLSSFAANVENIGDFKNAKCFSKLEAIIDSTVGKYMTEREMDFDGTVFSIKSVDEGKPYRVLYIINFSNQVGYIDITKRCKSYNAHFSFMEVENQNL